MVHSAIRKNKGVFDISFEDHFFKLYAEVHVVPVILSILLVGIISCIVGF